MPMLPYVGVASMVSGVENRHVVLLYHVYLFSCGVSLFNLGDNRPGLFSTKHLFQAIK